MATTPTVYEPITYIDDRRRDKGGLSAGAVVGFSALGGLGIVAVAAILVALFSGSSRRRGGGAEVNVNVTQAAASSQNVNLAQRVAQKPEQKPEVKQQSVQEILKDHFDFKPLEEAENKLVEINSEPTTGGIMNKPENVAKKWDPKKMIPKPTRSVRPEGSLAEKYGPSRSELASYLPTTMDMWKAQPTGPKFLRTAVPPQNVNAFTKPAYQGLKEHNDKLKCNRARVNEKTWARMCEAQRRVSAVV